MNQTPHTLSSVHVIVHGASGRMGARLCALAMETPGCALAGAIVRSGSPHVGRRAVMSRDDAPAMIVGELPSIPHENAAIIDFSSPEGSMRIAQLAVQARVPLLVGTTGLSSANIDVLRDAAKVIPVLLAPNTSLGVTVLAAAATSVARALGGGFRCSIVESHHAMKKDSPSGTAKRLASAVRSGGGDLADDQILAIRGGDVIGEHTIRFAGQGEYIELTHRATTRDLFARGAIHAAMWLSRQPPGWWTMEDVLNASS